MATRFRLTSSTTAPAVSPAIQTYTHTQSTRRQLVTSDTSTLTTSSYIPDAADHLIAGDAHHIQFVSDPMSSGLVFTSGDTVKFAIQGTEGNAANNLQVQLFVSVVSEDGTTVRATLRTKVLEGLEIATSLTSRFLTTTLTGSYTTVLGDRLVVEFSASGLPTASGGTQGHNASLRWGGGGSAGDLLENDTEVSTLRNPWIEFTTNVTFSAPQALTGTLFASAPTFFTGTVSTTAALTGTLFTSAATFYVGVIALGAIPYTNLVVLELDDSPPPTTDFDHFLRADARTVAGAGFIRLRLFQGATLIATNEFTPTGTFATYSYAIAEAEAALITDYADLQIHIDIKATGTPFSPEIDWVGLLRPAGVGDQALTGTLFSNPAVFQTGVVTPGAVALTGTPYTNPPTFFTGVISQVGADQNLTGVLHVHPPTFFQGRVQRAVPTGLLINEIGVLGHSNVGTFIQYYRSISARDLLTSINHGSYDIESWGDPGHADYAAAWAKLDDDEPVGGYRAFWVMLGFRNTMTDEPQNEAWADHIAGRLATDFPEVEFTWWSPMNTYFTTNPGDGDSEDLLTFDPWDTNPSSLTTWKGSDVESEMSWNNTKYAIAQGYADDYGPWINLTDAETDTDDRHPTEAPGDPAPNGQTHGGDVLLAFFEDNSLGLAGNLLTVTPTFFVGVVTPGVVALTGILYVSPPTFPTGALTSTYQLTGTLHVHPPTFFIGTVTAGTVTLTGTLHVHPPMFFTGVTTVDGGPQTLTGTLFSSPAVFPTGTITPGTVALTGTLFSSPPSFFAGSVAVTYPLTGVLFSNPPTFFVGDTIQDQLLTGTLFTNLPVFFVGIVGVAGTLSGTLFVNPPVFFTGTISQGAPSFWIPNPVGYTVNPVAFVRVGAAGPSPWGATLSGNRFEAHPLFPVGSVI